MEALTTGLIDWAVAESTMSGQVESGDHHLVRTSQDGALVAVVDGLGHGPEAAGAARAAVSLLEKHATEPVISLVKSCHRGMLGTRGVVMSVASFSADDETLTWVGVGNVEGVLLRAHAAVTPRREPLLVRGGVVGGRLPALYAAIVPIMRGDTLIFATDGVQGDFAVTPRSLADPPRSLADRILADWSNRRDDALVLVVRWLGTTA